MNETTFQPHGYSLLFLSSQSLSTVAVGDLEREKDRATLELAMNPDQYLQIQQAPEVKDALEDCEDFNNTFGQD